MKNIELIIENFTDWGKPWTFYDYVVNNSTISEVEKNYFSKIYNKASKFEIWNYPNLTQGVENSRFFLKENTKFSEKSITQIVNAIAYEWR